MPRVSVILATYNRPRLVVEAIHSVLAQTYRDYEIIVADDGSTDDTFERLAALDGHIRAVALKHSGMPEVARNRAIAIARGDLIVFLDDDDLWQREYLRRQVGVLDRDKNLGREILDSQNTSRIFEDFQATTTLNRRRRLLLRENLSCFHSHLGLLKLGAGELHAARQGFIQALQLNTFRRRAWIALLQSYAPSG